MSIQKTIDRFYKHNLDARKTKIQDLTAALAFAYVDSLEEEAAGLNDNGDNGENTARSLYEAQLDCNVRTWEDELTTAIENELQIREEKKPCQ